jgi:hypothetical protein
MGRLDEGACLELLRKTNVDLRGFLDRSSGVPVLGTNEEVDAMLRLEHALKSVGALLSEGVQSYSDSALREEFARYGENLLQLRQDLAAMQQSAQVCWERVRSRQDHLRSAKDWCAASRNID